MHGNACDNGDVHSFVSPEDVTVGGVGGGATGGVSPLGSFCLVQDLR